MFGLNPWILLAIVLAFGASNFTSYTRGYGNGEDAREFAWVKKETEQKAKTDAALDEMRKASRAKELELLELNGKTERDNAAQKDRINGLRIANGRLVAAAGGLLDRNGRPSAGAGGGGGSADSADAGGARGGPAGCRLSGELTEFLQSRFYDADRAATYAATCKAHVVDLYAKLANICPALPPL